jgi:GT2 family glycosyltransferase
VPSVSVIVPIFNGTEFLPAFFGSLVAALPDGSQVIIVDDGSAQPIWSTVPDFGDGISVERLQNQSNLGYCASVNRAFPLATGEIIVQLNSDLVLDPHCIGAMVDLISREENVGIVGSKLIYPTTGLVQHVGMAFGHYSKSHVFLELPADHPLCMRTRSLQILTSATAAMSRRVLDRIGPLDDVYYNHNDDIEHCLLAREHGFTNFMCADSVAYHWESLSGPARFAGVEAADGVFWARWGSKYKSDFAAFVDEALDHVLSEAPHLEGVPFRVLDLSRSGDSQIVLERLTKHLTGIDRELRRFRQVSNLARHLRLPLLLPHWIPQEPTPFIYIVDRYRELEENDLWFSTRRQIVSEELIVDVTGVAVRTSQTHLRK